jgi:DNA repair protein RecN (Recombination protein N)
MLTCDPQRLAELDERLDHVGMLARKHGRTPTDLLSHAETARERQCHLMQLSCDRTELSEQRDRLAAELKRVAAVLHERRKRSAPLLAAEIKTQLATLAMPDAEFAIELVALDRLGPKGSDEASFLIAPNPGVPIAALRDIASGGELSRTMLALTAVTAEHGDHDHKLLVFDEIDAGIGGKTANAVGRRLKEIGQHRQVLCITHLPQIAALADTHHQIAKDTSAVPVVTVVQRLDDEAVLAELVRMLGSEQDDDGALLHAQQLIAAGR